MSEKYFVQKATLEGIADVIREANGTTEPISFETESIKTTLKTAIENGSGGGDTDVEDSIIKRTITGTYNNDRVTTVGPYAFYGCSSLTNVNFPVCTSIGNYAFYGCSSLTTVSFPACTSIGIDAFPNCQKLTTVNFPVCTIIEASAFYNCTNLTTVSFPACTSVGIGAFTRCQKLTTVNFPTVTSIGNYAFQYCSKLTRIYLGASTLCTLRNSSAFGYTGITSTAGYIYVPGSLLASYKAATNWTYFSNRIFSYAF